jgi:predicted transcriptional regulator
VIKKLSEIRKAFGISQTEMAARMQTSQSYVSYLERSPANAHLETMRRVIESLGGTLEIVAVFEEPTPLNGSKRITLDIGGGHA